MRLTKRFALGVLFAAVPVAAITAAVHPALVPPVVAAPVVTAPAALEPVVSLPVLTPAQTMPPPPPPQAVPPPPAPRQAPPPPPPPRDARAGSASQTVDDEFVKGAYLEDTPDLVAPRPIRQPEPRYTSDAMRAKIQGIVVLQAVIGSDGTILRSRITQSLDKDYGLDAEALKAASQWVFEPGTLNGQKVPVLVELRLMFRLH